MIYATFFISICWICSGLNQTPTSVLTGHQSSVYQCYFTADADRVVTLAWGGTVRFWNLKTCKEEARYTSDGPLSCMAITKNRESLVVGGSVEKIVLLDLKGKVKAELQGHKDKVSSVAFSEDSRLVASGDWRSTIKIWSTANKKNLISLDARQGIIHQLVFLQHGKVLVSAGQNGTVMVWDVATGKNLLILSAHRGDVCRVAFSPNGNEFASAGLDGFVKIWDFNDKKLLRSFKAHDGVITVVDYFNEGKNLVTAGHDGMIRTWILPADQLKNEWKADFFGVMSLDFDPSGLRIMTCGFGKSAKIWSSKGLLGVVNK